MRKHQESLVKNSEESEKFLAENSKKEGIKTTASGLQYEILKEGSGVSPSPENSVKVHYLGTFIDGTEFDNSIVKGEPQVVKVDSVLKGWREILPMMRVGARWRVFVPPDLAYGRGGLGGKIPGNKVLVFEMELLSIEKPENIAN
jgi:FKBP-type peptidyl-prolyl cis-trans isomerase